jgi:hypothetical protein
MPDVTLQWLLQQPVFTPYRVRFQSQILSFSFSHLFQRKIQMNDRRQEDYDGQLNYEYIKLQSAGSSSSTTNHR